MNKGVVQTLINFFSESDSDATKMTKLSKRKNLIMDKTRETAKTSDKGIANFRLRILTATQ